MFLGYTNIGVSDVMHRITEQVRWEGATVACLLQPPCSGRVILEYVAKDCVQLVLEYLQ